MVEPLRRSNDCSALSARERYIDAPTAADFTIDQAWGSYTSEEHARWDRLFRRMETILPNRACESFLSALDELDLSRNGVPHMGRLSELLSKRTGWRVVPVAGLVPDTVFFDHLASRRFPAGAFMRSEAEFDYLEEPDIFHDIFGHAPLLANPVFADFMQAYGEGGKAALERGQLPNLARLYWYTVEFGLIRESGAVKIFGAGILSSPKESVFALESSSPNRLGFDLERIMRTTYKIDAFQQTYFVIDSFEALLDACYGDFAPRYERVRSARDLSPSDVLASDHVIHHGDQSCVNE
ncbi:MAG: phenylalanine 4-monooxygenase [Pseudomonadota bacterium]